MATQVKGYTTRSGRRVKSYTRRGNALVKKIKKKAYAAKTESRRYQLLQRAGKISEAVMFKKQFAARNARAGRLFKVNRGGSMRRPR